MVWQLNTVFVVFTAYSIMTLDYVQLDHIRGCHLFKPDMLLYMTAVKKLFLYVSCIIIVNDDQQDANILAYLFFPNQFYMFQAMSSPIVRSTWLYLQLMILSTDIAAGWCHGWDGTPFNRIHDTNRQQYRWTISEAEKTVKYSWWWAQTSPETCRAD